LLERQGRLLRPFKTGQIFSVFGERPPDGLIHQRGKTMVGVGRLYAEGFVQTWFKIDGGAFELCHDAIINNVMTLCPPAY
jgi:hypothetical protein